MPNVPKQRLHEYLNDDLLKALDTSPNIRNLNNGIENIKKNENDNIINNPHSLFGFSLYPSSNDKNGSNFDLQNNLKNNNIINDFSDFNILKNKENLKIDNNNSESNNEINLNNNIYNYNNDENLISKINIDNPTLYIPIKMRNKDKDKNNSKGKAEVNLRKNNHKNKYNLKKEGKNKRHFEVRIGDWTCINCNNLNFSFRNKCNRCGLPKELSRQKIGEINSQIYNQNINYQMIGGINESLFYENNINNKDMKFYKK